MTLVTTVYTDENDDSDIINLNKTVRDIVKHLDAKRKHAKVVNDLFTNSIEANRSKLLVCAERLMFTAPKEYGRQCEEIIWRKGFYETYSYIKQLKANPIWTNNELYFLQNVFHGGIGFYHHVLMRIQEDFQVNLSSILHFPILDSYGLEKFENDGSNLSVHTKLRPVVSKRLREDLSDWVKDVVYRCLIYLGDLNRYMLDVYPGWDLGIASEYYWRAVFWKPDVGQAFNQLATLSNYQNNIIDTVYYCLRCLCSSHPFEVAQGNLMPLLNHHIAQLSSSTESAPGEKVILSEFCSFIGIWFFRDNVDGVQELFANILNNLNVFYKRKNHSTNDNVIHSLSLEGLTFNKRMAHSVNRVFSDTIFKILVICCMCHHKRSVDGISNINAVNSPAMFITAITYHMLERVLIQMKVSLPELKSPAWKKTTEVKSFKRRRHRCHDNSPHDSDSNISDEDDSEEEVIFDIISDDDEVDISKLKDTILNGWIDHDTNEFVANGTTSGGDCKALIHLLKQNFCTLQAVKIAFDWLECNLNTLSMLETWTPFMENLVLFLNYISSAIISRDKNGNVVNVISDEERMQPLAEDLHLRSCDFLQPVHQNLNWTYDINNYTYAKQMLIRIKRFVDFGIFLAGRPGSKIVFDVERFWFSWNPNLNMAKQIDETKDNHILERGKLLTEITEIWLEEDMRQEEERIMKKNRLPLLVMDGDAFVHHYRLIKSIAYSKRFLLVVPSSTISVLDEMKYQSTNARDASRWLENQFKSGNPLIRSQRDFESRRVPNITYPKKKDRFSWLYMSVLEFCYYLTFSTTDDKGNEKPGITEVWLLTGSKELSDMINVDGQKIASTNDTNFDIVLAVKAIGINVEYIGNFYKKWKTFRKNHYDY